VISSGNRNKTALSNGEGWWPGPYRGPASTHRVRMPDLDLGAAQSRTDRCIASTVGSGPDVRAEPLERCPPP
jgi:hypothetical protein